MAPVISTPGAVRSGFTRHVPSVGPCEEKYAVCPDAVAAPTVSALAAIPGVPMLLVPGPALPAATTNSVPVSAASRSSACAVGSSPLPASAPRLRFTTSAPCAAAHSMPSITHDSCPNPSAPSTLPDSRRAPCATPLRAPPAAAPVPPITDATWVPCPLPSAAVGSSVKLACTATLPRRSGWSTSTPVSSTATSTPAPDNPESHASGAPIWVRLGSRSAAARTRRSSHTFAPAAPRASVVANAAFFGSRTAVASMLSSVTASVPAERSDGPASRTMTGTESVSASP
jgi:hypothetical protein